MSIGAVSLQNSCGMHARSHSSLPHFKACAHTSARIMPPPPPAGTTVGISVVVLVLLFAFQRYGTSRMGHAFAPVVILWLSLNAAIGIYNLAQHGGEVRHLSHCTRLHAHRVPPRAHALTACTRAHSHQVMKSISPWYVVDFFVRNGSHGWLMLGGAVLSITVRRRRRHSTTACRVCPHRQPSTRCVPADVRCRAPRQCTATVRGCCCRCAACVAGSCLRSDVCCACLLPPCMRRGPLHARVHFGEQLD